MEFKLVIKFINLLFIIILLQIKPSHSVNKYTKEANLEFSNLKDPFRMGKLNLIWEKARKVSN